MLLNFEQTKFVTTRKGKGKNRRRKVKETRYNHKATFAVAMMDIDSAPFLLEYHHIRAGTSSPKLFKTQTRPVTFLPLYETEYVRLATIAALSGLAGMFFVLVMWKICLIIKNRFVYLFKYFKYFY